MERMAAPILTRADVTLDKADIAWLMICSALVFLMVISISMVYSGLGSRLFAITLFKQPLLTGAMISFQWYLWGYALTFTPGNTWFGSLSTANGLQMSPSDVYSTNQGSSVTTSEGPSVQHLPELAFALFQGMFAAFTAALICAGTMQKMHSARYLLFVSVWSAVIYSPIARWSWYSEGWSHQLGSMDFAGGTPVHIASGAAVAAMSIFYFFESNGWQRAYLHLSSVTKKRINENLPWAAAMWVKSWLFNTSPWLPEYKQTDIIPGRDYEVYDVNQAIFGTGLLWFGWFGFNGGSALGANSRAVSACLATHVAACTGGTTTVFLHWVLKQIYMRSADYEPREFRRLTAVHFCDGAIAGLVAITPGSGYVPVSTSAIFGIVSSFVVYMLKPLTSDYLPDDELKVFLIHTVSGFIGMFLTGCFASQEVVESDGFSILTTASVSERLGNQMKDAFAGLGYSFSGTIIILMIGRSIMFAVKWMRSDKTKKRAANAWSEANIFKFGTDGSPAIQDRLRARERHTWEDDAMEGGIPLRTPDNDRGPSPRQWNRME
ncbi:hypothetical protein QC763_310010 [Podospora pseudopauciseta]|uniref:Ammonium transporter AmtB-like domain-containing protein n=1 Tax=Podospora pseudopauciseta TaxID=2093780 RepID=A0ABR0HHF5_9PEZI|nr:hypothetical protein QC763_310010 [Podospora pseudopauciseta]